MKTKNLQEKHIVVIGGGFAGLAACRLLARKAPEHIRITLFDKNEYHSFTSDLYEVASTSLNEQRGTFSKQAFEAVAGTTAIPFSHIIKESNISFQQEEISTIAFEKNEILLKNKKRIAYDYLILATGSSTDFLSISELGARAMPLKTVVDALNIRNALDEIFLHTPKRKIIDIIVGGGGYTGCEVAAELAGYIKQLAHVHGHPQANILITILEARETILGNTRLEIQKIAQKRLQSLGVDIRTKTQICDVTNTEVILKGGERIPCSILIWTAGVRANHLTEDSKDIRLGEKDRLRVDKELRLTSYKNIYAVGDAALVKNTNTKKAEPQTAFMAIHQGTYVAKAILCRETNKKPSPYKSLKELYLIPLGSTYAIADISGIIFSGVPAWFLKRLSALRYIMKLLSFREAVSVWMHGYRLFRRND